MANPFALFLLMNGHRLDDITPIRQRWVIGLAFAGARPFGFFRRVGGLVLLRPMTKKLIRGGWTGLSCFEALNSGCHPEPGRPLLANGGEGSAFQQFRVLRRDLAT